MIDVVYYVLRAFFSGYNLERIITSNSKFFTIHGAEPQSLVFEGQGFELIAPKDSCLPKEDCNISIDVVMAGDFTFPEGMEPVSAIYIVSVSSVLCQPLLLRLQHCVDLELAKDQSHLSFYRAPLNKSVPPYNFRPINGGRFIVGSQYGEIELQSFSAVVIGQVEDDPSDDDGSDSSDYLSPISQNSSDSEPEDIVIKGGMTG